MAFVSVAGALPRSRTALWRRSRVSNISSLRARCTPPPVSRRAFLVAAAGVVGARFNQSARAAEDRATSVESAQEARTALVELREAVDLQEWESLRVALRVGALGHVRSSCNALANNVAPGPQLDAARAAYRKLVVSVETLDTHALRASRGGDGSAMGSDLARAVECMDAVSENRRRAIY